MAMEPFAQIQAALEGALTPFGFRRRPADGVISCWVLRTFMRNRAVVVIYCRDDKDPALFAREQRGLCRSAAGFFIPVLYEIGLQIVVVGPPAVTDPLKEAAESC